MAKGASKTIPLIVAGIIFTLISIGHLLRVLYGIEIMVGNHVLSMNLSYVCFVVSAVLALWMFITASRK